MQDSTLANQLLDMLSELVMQKLEDPSKKENDRINKVNKYPSYLNTKQACKYLNVSYNTLKKWIEKNSDFPYHEIDGTFRFNRDELDKFMASK